MIIKTSSLKGSAYDAWGNFMNTGSFIGPDAGPSQPDNKPSFNMLQWAMQHPGMGLINRGNPDQGKLPDYMVWAFVGLGALLLIVLLSGGEKSSGGVVVVK
jgi:hypothetical protein